MRRTAAILTAIAAAAVTLLVGPAAHAGPPQPVCTLHYNKQYISDDVWIPRPYWVC